MTTRRSQQVPSVTSDDDLEAILAKQIKQEQARQEYQNRPEVKAKRREYQNEQTRQRKITRAAMKGDMSTLVEMGLTEEQAQRAISFASAHAS
jgi:Holliday junction resolvasome RuvABC DNA-binding subunit